MRKQNIFNNPIFLLLFTLLFLIGTLISYKSTEYFSKIESVFAEDEDEEDEDREEEDADDEEDEDDDYEYEDEEEYEYIYESVPIEDAATEATGTAEIIYTEVLDAGYGTDTDGDLLVDAIDPNPTIPQKELFTDDDNDGVPNANDVYKNDDDFKYLEYSDTNNNGVLDMLEYLP